MLSSKGKYNILGQADDGNQLLELLKQHKPDVVIMDMTMPRLDGLAAIAKMAEVLPTLPPILVLSADEREKNVRAALKAGVKGYLPKNANVEELEFAITSVMDGKIYLSPSITASLVTTTSEGPTLESPFSVLTTRELEILKHLADGKPNRDIGKLLHISTRTVDTHRSNILRKLNLRTNAELVKVAIAQGLIEV